MKTELKIAHNLGSRITILFMAIGLLIAAVIMIYLTVSWSESLDKSLTSFLKFIVSIWPNLLIGVCILFFTSVIFGRKAGVSILIKKRPKILIGIRTAFVVLITSTFLASWVGFIQEGIDNIGTYDNPFVDYIAKPMYWVMLFGSIPSLLLGALVGISIKWKGRKYDF